MSAPGPKPGRSPAEIWTELVAAQEACDAYHKSLMVEAEFGRGGLPSEEGIDRLIRVRGRIGSLLTDLSHAGVLREISTFLIVKYGFRP